MAGESNLDFPSIGSEQVANVAWQAAPFAGKAVAETFDEEPDAAVETLRR